MESMPQLVFLWECFTKGALMVQQNIAVAGISMSSNSSMFVAFWGTVMRCVSPHYRSISEKNAPSFTLFWQLEQQMYHLEKFLFYILRQKVGLIEPWEHYRNWSLTIILNPLEKMTREVEELLGFSFFCALLGLFWLEKLSLLSNINGPKIREFFQRLTWEKCVINLRLENWLLMVKKGSYLRFDISPIVLWSQYWASY